jgi:hypothetical protein
MFRSVERRGYDWRAILLLVWMIGVGVLYGAMIMQRKAPGLVGAIRAKLS